MSDKCGSCDCCDKTQCVTKSTSYTLDMVETQESYKEAMNMDVGAEENGCKCMCGSTCSCVNGTCSPN
uniref:Metallothionein 3 n=1 Tax=Noccaea caerulescens TaxID=107243 RepID=Q5SF08_NOCCA|nr:methallothionein type 3 [Noccaea caerulescens]ACR46963.1 metallothionein 3 [Noccaea caerulescens]ACR46964.1 metallothionein 3 [Noccaea caerulescens]